MNKPKEEQDCIDKGYKFLGWQKHTGNSEEIQNCFSMGHRGREVEDENGLFRKKTIDNFVHDRQHNMRGSDCTYWCDKCKIYWKIDMSD